MDPESTAYVYHHICTPLPPPHYSRVVALLTTLQLSRNGVRGDYPTFAHHRHHWPGRFVRLLQCLLVRLRLRAVLALPSKRGHRQYFEQVSGPHHAGCCLDWRAHEKNTPRCLVAWVALVDTTHTASTMYMLWYYVVANFTNPSVVGTIPWPLTAQPIFIVLYVNYFCVHPRHYARPNRLAAPLSLLKSTSRFASRTSVDRDPCFGSSPV